MIKKQGLKPKFKPIARGGWRRRAEPELIFNQIISFKVIFNLVTLMA